MEKAPLKYVDAAKLSEFPPGSRLTVELDDTGREIALFNIDGELFALDNTVPTPAAPWVKGRFKETSFCVRGTAGNSMFEPDNA